MGADGRHQELTKDTTYASVSKLCEQVFQKDYQVLSQSPSTVHCVRGADGMRPEFPCMALFTSVDCCTRYKLEAGRYASGMDTWQERKLSGATLSHQLQRNPNLMGVIVNPEP